MSLQQLQQLTDGTIMRNGIRHRDDGLEPELAILVRLHDTSAIGPRPVRMLHIVMARGISLPDVDFHAFDRVPGGVFDRADYDAGLALRVRGHARAGADLFGFVRVEGPEH